MKNKRSLSETDIMIDNKKIKNDFERKNFVSPSQLRNYILNDPLIDYLDYYRINTLHEIPNRERANSIVSNDYDGNKVSYPLSSYDYTKLNDNYIKEMELINLPLPKKVMEERLAKEKAVQLAEELAMTKTFKLTIDSLKTLTKDYLELHHPFDQVYVVKEDLNNYYKIIEKVKRMIGKKIIIVSATDCSGSFEYNENLSERRAKRIYTTLSKLSTNNIIIRNVGERELIEACDKASNNKALQKVNRYSYVFILDK